MLQKLRTPSKAINPRVDIDSVDGSRQPPQGEMQ
jgi:hypothetical protein